MLAYQMIYTACGKDRSGAFSVWAKSNEVTKTECDEIYKLMSYRKPKNVPYDPTEEELETLFPKKYAYFTLSSGRKCFAKCTYRHKVYSDLDARSGNFIIHAFIVENAEGVNPFAIFTSTAFKTLLTYKEWHDDPVPDSLPAVELDLKPNYSDAVVSKYLSDPEKSAAITSLAQSVINAADDEEKFVTFNAGDKEEQEIYSILGIILPPSILHKLTFANQYAPSVEFSLTSTGMKLVKIRNIFESALPAAFNYEMERDEGSYVFHFDRKIFASVPAGRYVADVINTLKTTNLFTALKLVEQIDNIMTNVKCDVDTATSIYHVVNNDLKWFNSADEFMKALKTAENARYVKESDFASRIYTDIIATEYWGFGSNVEYFIKLVLANSDNNVKDALIEKCFYNLDKFGVSDSVDPKSFVSAVKSRMPFTTSELAASILRNGKWNDLLANGSKNVCYLVFDAMLSLILSKAGVDNAFGVALNIFRQAVSAKDTSAINLYFSSVKTLGTKSENWFIENSASSYFNAEVSSEEALNFAFELVSMLSDKQEQAKLIQALVSNNIKTQFLMPVYIKFANANSTVCSAIEQTLRANDLFKDFFMRKEAFVFKNTATVNGPALDKYFDNYYVAGYDSGVYLAKLKTFVGGLNGKVKLQELFYRFDKLERLPDNFADVAQIISYLEQEIYLIPFDELLRLPEDQIKRLAKINQRVNASGGKSLGKFEMLCTVLLIQGKYGKDRLVAAINGGTLYSSLSHQQMDAFASKYTRIAIELYLTFTKEKGVNRKGLLLSIISPLFIKVNNSKFYFKEALDLIKNGYYEFMTDLMAYAFNFEDAFAAQAKGFIKWYVENMKRGDYKKLFKMVENLIDKDQLPPVKEYMDEFSKEHKGFFESLFGKKQ